MNEIYVKKALNMSAVAYFFINVFTLGFFFFYFQYKLGNIFKEVLKDFPDKAVLNTLDTRRKVALIAIIVSVVTAFGYGFTDSIIFDLLNRISSLVGMIYSILWAFTARQALRQYAMSTFGVDCSPNGFLLFFFGGTALTYKINDLENEIALKNMKEKM